MINAAEKAKAIELLKQGLMPTAISRKTGINRGTIQLWQRMLLSGQTSETEFRTSARFDSGALSENSHANSGWDVSLSLDLLRLKWSEFPRYLYERQRKTA